MKKTIIILMIIVVIGAYFYIKFDRFMKSENFKTEVENILQMGSPNDEAIRAGIFKKAVEKNIVVNPDEIFISIEDTEEKTIAGSIVGMAGMKVETKKLTVRFPFIVKSLGFSKTYNLERFRLFTVSASMPQPDIPQQ